MIGYGDAAKIVQKAIVRAGGYDEEHPKDRTLNNAGLKTGNQRESFQRKVARETQEYDHVIENVSLIPNDESTKVDEVRKHVADVAKPLETGD